MNNIDTFVSIVKDIKKQIASRKLGYRIGGNVMKLSSNNFSLNIRTDCSGFVSACVSCLKNKNIIFSTYSQSNALINNGFKKLPFTSWNELKTGDILMRDTHTEVFSHNEGNKHYVWNCGSDYSNNNSGVTLSIGGHHTVFRLTEGVINMANSPLVKYTKISPNKTLNKKYKVDTIIPHCIVGQMGIESLGDWFSKSSTKASSNYGIGFDGRVGMYVEEKDRSWCSSSSEWDNRAITIECASDLKSPYAMKKEVINTLIDLCTDICKRYNKTKLVWLASKSATLSYKRQPNEMLICVHRYLSNTACIPIESELLTKDGWKQLKDIQIGDEVASPDLDNLNITFEKVYDKVPEKKQDVYKLLAGCTATLDHRMVFRNSSNNTWRIETLNRLLDKSAAYIPMAGNFNGKGIDISDDMLKFLIAVQADGHYMYEILKNGQKSYYGLEFHLKKQRKLDRIISIIKNLDFEYSISNKSDGSVSIRIYNKKDKFNIVDICEMYLDNKCFNWHWLELNKSQVEIFFKEILLWDGCIVAKKYTSMDKINLDIISAIGALNNIASYINNNSIYFRSNPYMTLSGKSIRYYASRNHPGTRVSCVSVKTGLILIRQHGRPFIVGNCPGDYLMGKLSYVADEVNKRLGNNSSNISKEVIQKYHKGEIVMFSGDTHYLSTSSPTGSKCRPGKATVNSFESDGIHNYHLIGMQGGSGVWGWVDEKYISKYTEEDKKEIPKVEEKPKVDNTKKENTFKEYIVRIKTPYLNIRTGPGTNHGTTGKFTGKIAVTIIEEANGPGAPKWGLMKSYKDNRNGWISLDPQFVEKVY